MNDMPKIAQLSRPRPQFVTVTPELAAELLSNNPINRGIKAPNLARIKRAMAEGQFRSMNGETIKIAVDGRILDGQHRLLALLQLGLSLPFLIVYDVDPSDFSTIDTGKTRTPGDVAHAAGIPNANAISAAAAMVIAIDSGKISSFEGINRAAAFTRVDFVQRNPKLHDSLPPARGCGKMMSVALATALHFAFARIDRDAADIFFSDLASGASLHPGDPVYVLREKLIGRKPARHYMRVGFVAAMTIKAWNERRAGRQIKLLKLLDGEQFPRPR